MSPRCLHCDQPIPSGVSGAYCCAGCRTVHRILTGSGLDRYYALRRGPGVPLAGLHEGAIADRKWLEAIEARRAAAPEGAPLCLDVQGLHCAACVWLLEELFERQAEPGQIEVNPALGQVELRLGASFPLADWVADVEALGYRLGPATERTRSAADGLLVRAVVCLALAGNAMFFSAALYLGLESGELHRWVGWLSFVAASIAVALGAPIFLRSAWQALRRGVLHLDLPIALGILLAYAGSAWSFLFGSARASYLDTVSAFVGLMLLGRWLQTRVLEHNRRTLRGDTGAEGLLARRVLGNRVELIPCTEVAEGTELLVAPGDLVPVASALVDAEGSCSLDWVDGESAPRTFARGATIPSGAFNVGDTALRLRALEPFAASDVSSLLGARRDEAALDAEVPWWQGIGGAYVTLVLGASAMGFALWIARGAEPTRALEVAIATLVVTCPCAFGIATPLAYELTTSRLRRAGVFVRRRSFFDRARRVARIVFDKTGTLTTGRLELAEPQRLATLAPDLQDVLYDLTARSTHPKSAAVHRTLEAEGLGRLSSREAHEVTGQGVTLHDGERTYRLGAPRWAAPIDAAPEGHDLALSVDGRAVLFLATREDLRPEAATEVAALRREGFDLWILSGDHADKVRAMAEELGVPPGQGVGESRPEAKAAWLRDHDAERCLMVGDGLNDSLAVQAAGCSATPALDRPFMAARTDFYFVTPGLGPIAQSLRAARALATTVRGNLAFALVYNAGAIALCWAGLMQPWLAAVLMPSSSLFTIAFTTLALSPRSPLWKS